MLDLGASAGVFLDVIKGVALRTIAIEPANIYMEYLQSNGHSYYPYPKNAIDANEQADIVTSFDVIEHVKDPRDFIRSAYRLVKPGGTLILSMPNLNDLVRRINGEAFDPFYFQTAHLNYFGKNVIPALFEGGGFVDIEVDYLHKYGIENMVRWAKYGSVGEIGELDGVFDRIFNEHYRAEIERMGLSSHLFISAKKKL